MGVCVHAAKLGKSPEELTAALNDPAALASPASGAASDLTKWVIPYHGALPSPAPTGTAREADRVREALEDSTVMLNACAREFGDEEGAIKSQVNDNRAALAATPAQAYREGRAHGAEVAAVRELVTADREAGLDAAIKLVETRRQVRWEMHGYTEPDTNASYFTGAGKETNQALDEEDEELVELIRALKGPGDRRGVEGGWVKMSERKPASGERVEVYAKGWSSVAHGWQDYGKWHVWFGSGIMHLTPDLWRPLPAPPSPPAHTTDQQEADNA
jgi:hypothetical protein